MPCLKKQYLRIAQKVLDLWGSDDFDEYVNGLVVADREDRQGFPQEIVAELVLLSLYHDTYLRKKAEEENPWAFEKPLSELEAFRFREGLPSQGLSFVPQSFFQVIEQGNTRIALDFIRAGMDVDSRRSDQWTPLMMALFHKQEETALMLIQRGADINAIAERGYQPIHWSTLNGYAKATALLLKKGANANAATHYGWTPLLQAATKGAVDIAEMLLQNRAYVDGIEHQGFSALHKACANEHVEMVKLLLAKQARPNLRALDGSTPMTIARKKKNDEILALLQHYGAKD